MTEAAGVTFSEMIDVCSGEASRIETVQLDLVEAGLRAAPSGEQLRRKQVFEAIIHMIDLVRGDQVILDRLKKKTAPSIKDNNRGSEVSNRVAGSGAG
jgi:hypothetical protein